MAKIKTVIADDESLARERIRTLLAEDPDIDVVEECASGLETVAAVQTYRPALLFLDIQMPELDGFGVLGQIEEGDIPTVVFVTAYDQYALQAFEVHALDYLLKPFDRDRFQKALQRAKSHVSRHEKGELNTELAALLADLKSGAEQNSEKRYLDRLVVKSKGRVVFLKTDELDWIEAARNYVRLFAGGQSHLLRDTLSNIETKLDPKQFLRVHRSAIVRIDSIKQLEPWFHGEYVVTLHDGTKLTSSRSYSENMKRLVDESS